MSSSRFPTRTLFRTRVPSISTISSRHPLTTASRLSLPRKDAQDKDSINTEANEYAKSGTDDAASHLDETAFDPNVTDPQKQEQKAGTKADGTYTGDNPLNVSPANPEVSKPRDEREGGPERGAGQQASGGSRGDSGGKGMKTR